MVKAHKISFYVFVLLIIVSIVVFGLFFGVGFDHTEGKYNAPEHTGTLIYWMYAMAVICVLAAVVGAIGNTISSFGGPKGINMTGVPTTAISIVSIVIFLGSLVIGWGMASDAPLMLASGKMITDTFDLFISDLFIYSIAILMAVATLALIVNLSGVFKK